MTGLRPLALLTLFKEATCRTRGRLSIRPAEQPAKWGRGTDQVATWARAQEGGWILTLELKGHKLAALTSYKNGKSRFFMI